MEGEVTKIRSLSLKYEKKGCSNLVDGWLDTLDHMEHEFLIDLFVVF